MGIRKTARQFVSFIHDSLGGVRLFTSPGWTDNRLLWTGDSLNESKTEHFIFDRKSDSEFVKTYELKSADAWKPVDANTCTRKQAR